MSRQETIRHVPVRGDIAQHQLDCIFQELHSLEMNVPLLGKDPRFIKQQPNGSLLQTCSTVDGVTNLLRVLKKKNKKLKKYMPDAGQDDVIEKLPNMIFCRPFREAGKDQKVFWLLKNHRKQKLQLDRPKAVLVLPRDHLLTIQRKYINLYQIQENLSLSLKHFDSTGIGKRMTLVDINYISFKSRDYIVLFRNQKQNFQIYFQALVYEIVNNKLRFVKKSNIIDKQIISPAIFYEQINTRKGSAKFCLILGGKDKTNSPHYNALQLNLHILLNDYLTYDIECTNIIPFPSKTTILSGKVIKYEHKSYIFCSQQQTINQVTLQHESNNVLANIEIKSQRLDLNERYYFSEDSVKSIYDGEQQKIILFQKNRSLAYKSFHKIIQPFLK